MGAIRKTISIGTLGLVSFRSKSERLARAEDALAEAEAARAAGEAGRRAAEDAVAEQVALRRRDRRAQKRRRRAEQMAGAVKKNAQDALEDGAKVVKDTTSAARERVGSLLG